MTPAQRMLQSRSMTGFTVALATFGLILFIRQMGWLQDMELALYDKHMKLQQPVLSSDSAVVIIQIDEAYIKENEYPIPDGVLADALGKLTQMQASAIGIDFFRDKKLEGRKKLAAIAKNNPSIVFVERATELPDSEKVPEKSMAAPEFLTNPDQIGFADLKQDANEVIRRGLLMLWKDDDVKLSFSLQLALAHLKDKGITLKVDPDNPEQSILGKTTLTRFQQNDGGYQNVDDGGYQFLIDYKRNDFLKYSFNQFMQGKIPETAIHGGIVLIGIAAESVQDKHVTPKNSGWGKQQHTYGVEIHAHLIDQLLRGAVKNSPPVKVLSQSVEYWLVLLGALLGAWLAVLMEQKTIRLVVASMVVAALLVVTTHLLFLKGLWITVVPVLLSMVISLSITEAWLAQRERKAFGQMKNMFGKFVSPEVADLLWDQRDDFLEHGKPKPQRLTATVMITDLQGFVSATQNMDPGDLMIWLNRYLDEMTQIAMQYGGIVDDYAGDGIKINFGVPIARTTQEEIGKDACAAVDCALAMGRTVKEINLTSKTRGMPEFKLRVGINTGTIIVGSLGSKDRMKYTTVGDIVNTAARLESFHKQEFKDEADKNLRILISQGTLVKLDRLYEMNSLGKQLIPGKKEKIEVFRIVGKKELYSIPKGAQ